MWDERLQDAARELQAALRGQIGVGHAGQIECLPCHLVRVLAGDFHSIDLRLEPLAPVFPGPAILRQEHRVAIGAAERTADIRIARPVEAAAQNVAGRWAEDRPGIDLLHNQLSLLANGPRLSHNTSNSNPNFLSGYPRSDRP